MPAETDPNQNPAAPVPARMRLGRVQASPAPQADFVWVEVDGAGVVQATYLSNYIPVPGDWVVISQNDTDWFVHGGRAGYAGNRVTNPWFDQHPQVNINAPLPAYGWGLYTASGPVSSVAVSLNIGTGAGAGGGPVTSFFTTLPGSGLASNNTLYSMAYPVTPGATLYGDAAANLLSSAGILTTMTLRIAWLTSGQVAYPGAGSESTLDTRTSTSGVATISFQLTGSVVVPAGITYARTLINLTYAGGGGGGYFANIFRIESRL